MRFTTKAKQIWDDNKGTIAIVAVVTTVTIAISYGRFVAFTNIFLDAHELSEEFYGF